MTLATAMHFCQDDTHLAGDDVALLLKVVGDVKVILGKCYNTALERVQH